MPGRYRRLSAVDLFAVFLQNDMPAKGMMATGYGSSGWGAGVYLSWGPDSFILPGVFSLSVEAGASASASKTVMLAIHRAMPRKIASLSDPAHVIWTSGHPVALVALSGTSYSAQLTAGASIGAGVEVPTGSETADEIVGQISSLSEIPLAIEVSATAGASYTYDRLYAIDPAPRWYPHSQDPALIADFNRILYAGDSQTREDLIRWIDRFDRQVFPLDQTSLQLLNQNPARLQQAFVNRIKGQFERDREKTSHFRSSVIGFARNTFPTAGKLSDKLAGLYATLSSPNYTTGQLIVTIDNLKAMLPTAQQIQGAYVIPAGQQTGGIPFYLGQPEDLPLMQSAVDGMRAQLDTFRGRLAAQQSTAVVSGKGYNRFNCFLKIASHAAGAEASVNAAVPAAYANAGIQGKYKRAAYRYQTVAPGHGGSLIYTQDTSITYRLATAGAQAGVAVSGFSVGKDFIAGMSYQSACAYWIYEEALTRMARPRLGSGLSYGASAKLSELIECIRAIEGLNLSNLESWTGLPATFRYRRLIYTLSRYLRVSFKYLVAFLYKIDADRLKQNTPLPAVLLESSFVVPLDAGFLTVVEKRKKSSTQGADEPIYRLDGIRNQPFASATEAQLNNRANAFANCRTYLDTIRLRGRMADYQDSSFTFKLGLPIAAVPGLTAGITLSNIENAGREGVVELFTRHYRLGQDDDFVPPVALFYQ